MVIFAILLLPFASSCRDKVKPIAKNGVIDLRNWDFKKYGSVPLQGEWIFYWKQLIHDSEGSNPIAAKVPSRWTKYKLDGKPLHQSGYGTYKLKVLLPPGLNSTYSLNYYQNMIGSPKKVMINGLKIIENGLIQKNAKENTYPYKRSFYNSEILNDSKSGLDSFEIFVQNSNAIGEQSGLLRYPEIGERSEINKKHEMRIVLNSILCGFFIMLFLYYLAMFLLQRGRIAYLYFSILCMAFVLTNTNLDWVSLYGLNFHTVFVIGYGLAFFFPLFMNSVCDKKMRLNKITYTISTFGFTGPILTLIFDLWEKYYFSFFAPHMALSNILSFSLSVIVTFRNWRYQKNLISFSYFLTGFIVLPFLVNDILYGFLIIQSSFLLNKAFVVVVIMQAFILAWSNALAHNDVKILARKLGNLNIKLEEKVDLRTMELQQKNQSMSKILENIHQGIFMIDENLVIDPQYSNRLTEIIGDKEIDGKNITNFFLSKVNLSAEDVSQAESALMCCVGESDFTFKLNSGHLPREVTLQVHAKQKQLEVSWEPIVIDHKIDKLMVSIREVTEIRRLREQADADKVNNKKLVEIIRCGFDNFSNNINNIDDYLNKSREIIIKLNESKIPQDGVNEIFRNLHTIKGNARSLQLSEIVKHAHESEQILNRIRKNHGSDLFCNEQNILTELDKLKEVIGSYRTLFLEKLGGSENKGNKNINLEDMTDKLISVLDKAKNNENEYKKTHEIVYKSLQQLKYKNLSQILEYQLATLQKDAIKLEKPVPLINWGGTPIWIPKDKSFILSDIFGHLLRNSLAHGLEKPGVRKAKGKPEFGTLNFSATYTEKNISLKFYDDGQGLDMKELRKKQENNHNATDIELAELVFKAGVSTSKQVNDISGRGVGMDAVRSFLRKQDGDIWIEFFNNKDSSDLRPFQFVMVLPFVIPEFLRKSHELVV